MPFFAQNMYIYISISMCDIRRGAGCRIVFIDCLPELSLLVMVVQKWLSFIFGKWASCLFPTQRIALVLKKHSLWGKNSFWLKRLKSVIKTYMYNHECIYIWTFFYSPSGRIFVFWCDGVTMCHLSVLQLCHFGYFIQGILAVAVQQPRWCLKWQPWKQLSQDDNPDSLPRELRCDSTQLTQQSQLPTWKAHGPMATIHHSKEPTSLLEIVLAAFGKWLFWRKCKGIFIIFCLFAIVGKGLNIHSKQDQRKKSQQTSGFLTKSFPLSLLSCPWIFVSRGEVGWSIGHWSSWCRQMKSGRNIYGQYIYIFYICVCFFTYRMNTVHSISCT